MSRANATVGGVMMNNPLRGMTTFRLTTVLCLLALKSIPFKESVLGEGVSFWFLIACVSYLVFAISADFFGKKETLPLFDMMFLMALLKESGQYDSGLGFLLAFPAAAAGLMWKKDNALALASFMSLMLLGLETFWGEVSFRTLELSGYVSASLFFAVLGSSKYGLSLPVLIDNLSKSRAEKKKVASVAALALDLSGEGLVITDDDGIFMNDNAKRWFAKGFDESLLVLGARCEVENDVITCKNMFEANGQKLGIFESSSETERLAREMKLKSLGMLVSNVAHEIRNPLSGIRQSVELMLEDGANERMCKIALRNTERIDNIVKMISGELLSDREGKEPVDLGKFVSDLSGDAFVLGQVSVEGTGRIVASIPMLERVIGNLLKNAVGHSSGKNASVHVRIYASQDKTCVAVSDDGPGVSATMVSRLFEPFSSGGAGMGLGLYIAKTSAVSVGGDVVHAGGSCFIAYFPPAPA